MVGVIKEIDGQKVIIPMSGGNGNPLGTIIAVYSNVCPSGYLPCGVDFDENQYPALFALLGTNHTPEEGFEMDWANAESVTLSTRDYIVTKNGWLVGWCIASNNVTVGVQVNGVIISQTQFVSGQYVDSGEFQIAVKKGDIVKVTGTLFRQSVSLVPYKYRCCIKARSGLDEMQQDYVLNALNEAGSYSTEEVATGKKWIDGKTIYRKVWITTRNTYNDGNYYNIATYVSNFSLPNYESITNCFITNKGQTTLFESCIIRYDSGALQIAVNKIHYTGSQLVIEYTKTT